MNINKWLSKNTHSLGGKTVALTGSTGGIGRELSMLLAGLGARLVLVDRNRQKAELLKTQILKKYPKTDITLVTADLESEISVFSACSQLENIGIDVLIHNAGAYSIPKRVCESGYSNVFQINFLSPYYMVNRLLPQLRTRKGHVVVVGSIAHGYSKSDKNNIDFKNIKADSRVYGNAKRYLMAALPMLLEKETAVSLAVTHPGIAFTNITAHYPPWLFAVIKYPMKIIFHKPIIGALSVLKGVFSKTGRGEWLGPWLFSVWGRPRKQRFFISPAEQEEIFSSANTALLKYGETLNENR